MARGLNILQPTHTNNMKSPTEKDRPAIVTTRQKARKLPEIPHTSSLLLSPLSPDGSARVSVVVNFSVPSRVAAHLEEKGKASIIPSAGIGGLEYLARRVRRWSNPCGKKPPTREHLHSAADEGCDTPICVHLSPEEWHLIGQLCGRLRITPGQWFVACAGYNAQIAEESIEKTLLALAS
jgi:hypothetical protein